MSSPLLAVVTGARLGALGGLLGGFVLPWCGLAVANADPLGLVLIPIYGWFTAPVGAAYGLVTGTILAAVASPLRTRPRALARLRPAWAAGAAVCVTVISVAVFGWDTDPGPNETMLHVREDILSLYVAPAVGAAILAAWLTPKIAIATSD